MVENVKCRKTNNKCWCECKNPKEHNACNKDYIWNPATCSCVVVKMENIQEVLLTIH